MIEPGDIGFAFRSSSVYETSDDADDLLGSLVEGELVTCNKVAGAWIPVVTGCGSSLRPRQACAGGSSYKTVQRACYEWYIEP